MRGQRVNLRDFLAGDAVLREVLVGQAGAIFRRHAEEFVDDLLLLKLLLESADALQLLPLPGELFGERLEPCGHFGGHGVRVGEFGFGRRLHVPGLAVNSRRIFGREKPARHGRRLGHAIERDQLLAARQPPPARALLLAHEGRAHAEALRHPLGPLERAADESHLRVLALEQRSAGLALAGRFAESDAAKKAALAAADAQANRESYRQKSDVLGMTPGDARAAVGTEQRRRDTDRQLAAETFRQTEGRQLTQRELARGLKPGDLEKGQRMADEDTVRGYLRKAQDAGIYGAEANDFARRSAAADIHDQVQGARASAPAIVSSLARIGGGGNVSTNNFNALKEEAVRQRQLLEIIAENTKNPAGAGRIK